MTNIGRNRPLAPTRHRPSPGSRQEPEEEYMQTHNAPRTPGHNPATRRTVPETPGHQQKGMDQKRATTSIGSKTGNFVNGWGRTKIDQEAGLTS